MTSNFTKAALLASVSLCATGAAMAQNQAANDIETVVVSGSRIVTPGFQAPTPVTSVTAKDIYNSGEVTVGDVLNQMPQFGIGGAPVGTWSQDYGAGGDYVN